MNLDAGAFESTVAVSQAVVSESAEVRILLRLKELNPATQWVKVEKSPIGGLYKLTALNGKIAYTDESATYLILGVVLNLTTGKFVDKEEISTKAN